MSTNSTTSSTGTEIDGDPSIIVMLDPTSDDGEAALSAVADTDLSVGLVVLISGATSHALRDYARAESIDLDTAGWNYLEQVSRRHDFEGRPLELIVASGPDAGVELSHLAVERPSTRFAVPQSALRRDRRLRRRLSHMSQVEVVEATVAAA